MLAPNCPILWFQSAIHTYSALHSIPAQHVAEAELNSLRDQAHRNKKEIAFLKEKLQVKGCRNRELENQLKELERKYEAEKTLMETRPTKPN